MKNQMKFSCPKTAGICLAVLLPFCLIATYIQLLLGVWINCVLLPVLILLFPLYRWTLKSDVPRALAVYVGVCAAQTFPTQFTAIIETHLRFLTGGAPLAAAVLHLVLACIMPLLAAYPALRYCTWIIDCLDFPKIWYSTVLLSSLFLIFNLLASFYSTANNGVNILLLLLESCALALLVSAYSLFYQGSRLILERAKLEQQSQLLEIQSHQYRTLQEHIQQTAQLRHDFRHSVRLLSSLAEQGNLEGIRSYLTAYEHNMAENTTIIFCANATLNALLGYYHEAAVSCGVVTDWKIRLPEPLTVSELDMASLLGNIIENGIDGCRTLPQNKRYFSLTTEVRHGSMYIVSTNSFDGHVNKVQGGYRSIKHRGGGIGLSSIAYVAEKYSGTVQISNTDKEFYVDIILKL